MGKIKKLMEEFNDLNDDKARWKWIAKHQQDGIIVWLDNDDTFATFRDDEDGNLMTFNGWLGNSDGVISLLDSAGIYSEGV